jgi:hypothetical protein
MFGLDELFGRSVNRPDQGLIELRFAYNVKDNSITVFGAYGNAILSVKLDKLAAEDPKDFLIKLSEMLKSHALEVQEEAKMLAGPKDEYLAWAKARDEKAKAKAK